MEPLKVDPEELRRLEVWRRAVRLENLTALVRRWRFARSSAFDGMRSGEVEQRFPGQRDLLDLLAVCTQEEVERMADCATPLFTLRLRCTPFKLSAYEVHGWSDPLEAESVQEAFLALSSRLDVIRTHLEQARIAYGMSTAEVNWLSRFSTHELYALAHDPSMVLSQAVRAGYFLVNMSRELDRHQRTRFSAVSRLVRTAATPV